MTNLATPYLVLLIILGSITITTVIADTVTINTYPYKIQDNSANQRLVITNLGNVGIGTANPYVKLDVPGNLTFTQDSSYPIRASDSIDSRRELLLGYYANSEIGIIQAAKTGVAWEPMTLNPNGGNVGIGTMNPGAKLEVSNQITISSANQQTSLNISGPNNDIGIQLENTGTNGRSFQLLSSGGTSGLGQGKFTIFDATTGGSNGAKLVIDSSGNVGIGNTNPSQKLDVNGNVRLTGNIVSPNDICIGSC